MASPTLSTTLLDQPASRAVRTMALAYLQHVLREAARVEVPIDDGGSSRPRRWESVHDFRVALRRLRTWLRLWRPTLDGSVRTSTLRRLRRLARRAGEARDLESLCEGAAAPWLRGSAASRASTDWMRSSLARRYDKALRALATRLLVELGPLARELGDDLRVSGAGREAQPTLRQALASLLGTQLQDLPMQIARASRSADDLHELRIALRRCRYILDSLCRVSPAARSAARQISRVQDVIGRWRDASIMLHRLDTMTTGRGTARPGRRGDSPSAASIAAMRALLESRIVAELQCVQAMLTGPAVARLAAAGARVEASLAARHSTNVRVRSRRR